MTQSRAWTFAFLLLILVWLGLFLYASGGVRGSDQYWYVSEVRAVVAGDPRTNSLWPHFLLGDPNYIESRPFIHQGAMPYIIASLGGVLDPYRAWIAFNLIAAGLGAWLIYTSLRRLDASPRVAGIAATLYLLLPSTLWHASQPLVETTVALLSAAMIAVAVRPWNPVVKFAVLIVLAMIGQQIITIFQPVLLAVLAGFLWAEWRGGGTRSIRLTLLYLLIAGLCFLLISLKESTLGFSITQLMMNGTPGGTNMDLWLHEGTLPFSPRLFMGKLFANLLVFATPNTNQIFFLPFFALLLAIGVGLFAKWRQRADIRALLVGYVVLVALGVYAIVIMLHQNQARYILYILPILIVAAAWLHHERIERLLDRRAGTLAVSATALSLIAVGAVLAMTLRMESATSARESAAFRRVMTGEPAVRDAKVLIECYHGGASLQLTYAIPEKLFVHISPEHSASQLKRIAERSGTDLLFCPAAAATSIRESVPDLNLHPVATTKIGPIAYEISRID